MADAFPPPPAGPDPAPAPPIIGPPPPRQAGAAPGAAPMEAPPPGEHGAAAPPAPSRRRRRSRLLIGAAVVVVVLVLAGLAVSRRGGSSFEAAPVGRAEGPAASPTDEVWSVDLGGDGYGTIIAGPDVVYRLESQEEVTAYDAADGDELWSVELADAGSLFPATPLGDDAVLIRDEPDAFDPVTRLLDARSGDERWEAEGAPVIVYRDSTSADALAIHDLDVVLLRTGDSDVVAVDRRSGDERWRVEGAEQAGVCGEVVLVATGDPDDAVFSADGVRAVDPSTGEEVWSADGGLGQCRAGLVAVADEGRAMVLDGSTGEVGDEVAIDEEDGLVVATPMVDTVLVQQVTSDAGARTVVYPRDGGEAVLEADDVVAAPVGADTILLSPFRQSGEHRLVRAADGEELAVVAVQPGLENDCVPVFTPTVLIPCIAGAPQVAAFALDDGEQRWELDLSEEPASSLAVVGEHLATLSPDALVVRTAP